MRSSGWSSDVCASDLRLFCEVTGAGRQSVLEALQILLRDGYVTNEPNRGFRVAILDASEAADIYQVRSVLEGLAAQNFINLASETERVALERALDSLEVAVNREDVEAQLQAVEQIGRAWCRERVGQYV